MRVIARLESDHRRLSINWSLLALIVLGLAALLGWKRYTAHSAIADAQRERLAHQVGIVESNLARQLQTAANALDTAALP